MRFPPFLDISYPKIRWFSIALEASPARPTVRCPAWAEACQLPTTTATATAQAPAPSSAHHAHHANDSPCSCPYLPALWIEPRHIISCLRPIAPPAQFPFFILHFAFCILLRRSSSGTFCTVTHSARRQTLHHPNNAPVGRRSKKMEFCRDFVEFCAGHCSPFCSRWFALISLLPANCHCLCHYLCPCQLVRQRASLRPY